MDSQEFYKMLDEVKQEELEKEKNRQQKLVEHVANKNNWSYDSDNDEFIIKFDKSCLSWFDDLLCSVLGEYLGKRVYWCGDRPKEGGNYVLLCIKNDDGRVYVSFIE